jgi:hypothetical protein
MFFSSFFVVIFSIELKQNSKILLFMKYCMHSAYFRTNIRRKQVAKHTHKYPQLILKNIVYKNKIIYTITPTQVPKHKGQEEIFIRILKIRLLLNFLNTGITASKIPPLKNIFDKAN